MWLEKGDRNSKFFHQFASESRRTNKIKKLVTEEGGVVTEEGEMQALVSGYYKILFESRAGDRLDELLQHVLVKVPGEMKQALCREISTMEN